MTWPVHHGSPSSAGATAVVLPAPGGAISTAARWRQGGQQVRQDGVDGQIVTAIRPESR
jgi:hypothetical protein